MINNLLTDLARSVRTATTSGQYSPVRPSRSVSKRLLICFSTQIGMILKKHLNSRSLKQVGARSFGKIKTRLNTVMVPYRHTFFLMDKDG